MSERRTMSFFGAPVAVTTDSILDKALAEILYECLDVGPPRATRLARRFLFYKSPKRSRRGAPDSTPAAEKAKADE